MHSIRMILMMLLVSVFLVACGGVSPSQPTQAVPPAVLGTQNSGNLPFLPGGGADAAPQQPPGPGGSFAGQVVFLTEFTDLPDGEQVALSGMLMMEDDEAFLVDTTSSRVKILLPSPAFQANDGQTLNILGVVGVEDDGVVVIRNASIYTSTPFSASALAEAGTPQQPAAPGSSAPPFAASRDVIMDFQLEPELTALQAYDALYAAAEDALTGLEWVALRGNSDRGWELQFRNADNNDSEIYNIAPGGGVLLTGAQLPPFMTNLPAIDRARVVVDSPQVEQPDAFLRLFAAPDGSINWAVDDGTGEVLISATE